MNKESIKKMLDIFGGEEEMASYYKEILSSHQEMLELFFSKYFEKTEGPSCSFDKASFTISKILKALEEKKVLPLQESYDLVKFPQMKEYEGKIAYWCPKTLKNTDEAIELVYSVLSWNFERLASIIKDERK
ncbi:hypothetical protein [Lactococcus allomyrinae]|uniref:Uncharacterized protein n=1 Tax=Lactococcus allomyrinae TaxID=2419773 RepID=A0A387B864_9LACT|nr:hypothetical protein [Lactococcus allomyrinae]AYF99882.1 hypothetical protein D7I46_01550 [Lactococcus allomyrinae]